MKNFLPVCIFLLLNAVPNPANQKAKGADRLFAEWQSRLSQPNGSLIGQSSSTHQNQHITPVSYKMQCDSLGCAACDDSGCDRGCCDSSGQGCDSAYRSGRSSSCGCCSCLQWYDGGSCLDNCLPRTDIGLPLLSSMADDRGVTLPLPVGTSLVATFMKRNVAVSEVRIGTATLPLRKIERAIVNPFVSNAENQIARADLWVLPCLNVYGLAGHTHSYGSLILDVEDFPLTTSPDRQIPISFELNGFTYGGGATAAIGTKNYFAALDLNYSKTDFNELDNTLSALVVTPRFGAIIDRKYFKGEVHVGVMYQDTKQTVEVLLEEPGLGQIAVEVDQYEPDPWNLLFGGLWGIDERLQLMIEAGVGGREYLITGATVRF